MENNSNKALSIILFLTGILLMVFSKLVNYSLYNLFQVNSMSYLVFLFFKNYLFLGSFISCLGIIFFLKNWRIRKGLIILLVVVFGSLIFIRNESNVTTTYKPIHFNLYTNYTLKSFLKEMEKNDFKKIAFENPSFNYYNYKFVRFSESGLKETLIVQYTLSESNNKHEEQDKEIGHIIHSITFYNKKYFLNSDSYNEFKSIFNKYFTYSKELYESYPDKVSYPSYKLDVWGGGYGKKSRLINSIEDDLVSFKWTANENVGYLSTVSLSGYPDKKIEYLSKDNVVVTIMPEIIVSYMK